MTYGSESEYAISITPQRPTQEQKIDSSIDIQILCRVDCIKRCMKGMRKTYQLLPRYSIGSVHDNALY